MQGGGGEIESLGCCSVGMVLSSRLDLEYTSVYSSHSSSLPGKCCPCTTQKRRRIRPDEKRAQDWRPLPSNAARDRERSRRRVTTGGERRTTDWYTRAHGVCAVWRTTTTAATTTCRKRRVERIPVKTPRPRQHDTDDTDDDGGDDGLLSTDRLPRNTDTLLLLHYTSPPPVARFPANAHGDRGTV